MDKTTDCVDLLGIPYTKLVTTEAKSSQPLPLSITKVSTDGIAKR